MGKTGRKIWYGVAMFLCGLTLLLSIAGIAGVWITERALANTVIQVLDAVDNVTESLRQATQGIDQKLERMQSVSIFISTASARVSQKVTDEGLIMLLLPEEKEMDLLEVSTSVKEAVSPLRDLLSTGLVIYRSVDQLPFINLPAPSQEQVDEIEESVGEIQTAADGLEAEITAFRTGTSEKIDKVETGANSLTSRLDQARERLANLDARLGVVQESLIQLQETALAVLVLVAILVTLLMVWLIYSQVELLRLYIHRWKASGAESRIDEPPNQANGVKDEKVIETGSMEPDNSDI